MTHRLFLAAIAFVLIAQPIRAQTNIQALGLIPRPQSISTTSEKVDVSGKADITGGPFPAAAAHLAKQLHGVTPAKSGGNVPPLGIRYESESGLAPDAYRIDVRASGIVLTASKESGAFYATQTLLQLLTEQGMGKATLQRRGVLQGMSITDSPRFSWRGFMLDSSRHFQPKEDIFKWLDYMAMHKLNVFHWHIVDSHGWRLEIKKYPRLTSQAAWREQPPIGRYGGFYTHADVREVVAYAKARHITVVPEIEMPGHSQAAVAAYPELLACDPNQVGETAFFYNFPHTRQEFPNQRGADVMCPSKETTYKFISDVLAETMKLFPGTYIHVGGDEVDDAVWAKCKDCAHPERRGLKDYHALQSVFMQRIEKQLIANGRRLIGWDEIIEGGLSPTAAVTSWRGTIGGVAAAKSGHYTVMSPNKPLYLDHGQSFSSSEPPHWPGRETLEDVYTYEPIPAELTTEQSQYVLGLQGNLWSIFTTNQQLLEIQGFPRLCAIAEVGWSGRERPAFSDFASRLTIHKARLKQAGINFWDEPISQQTRKTGGVQVVGNWTPDSGYATGKQLRYKLESQAGGSLLDIRFQYTGGADALSIRKVALEVAGKVVSVDFHDGMTGSADNANKYRVGVPKGIRPTDAVWLLADVYVVPWARGGKGDSQGTVTVESGVAMNVVTYQPEVQPKKQVTTTLVAHNRDKAIYDWPTRHAQVLRVKQQVNPDVIVIGDSIMHYWAGVPLAPIIRGEDSWIKAFGQQTLNAGFGWDRTENVLWRLQHGELKGTNPRVVVVAIGTNNLGLNTVDEVVDGIDAICQEVHRQLPKTKILVLGILPRADASRLKAQPDQVNFKMQTRLHPREYIDVFDAGNAFLTRAGELRKELFSDGLHPNKAGYAILADVIAPHVERLLGRKK
jgi:hexosaminidase